MKGEEMASVGINAEKVKEDLQRMGITMKQVSQSMGKCDGYLAQVLSRDQLREETINEIEKALFKPKGTYVTGIREKEAERESATEANLANVLASLSERLDGIEDAIPEDKSDILFERIQNLEGVMRQTNTWLARMYAVWTNREEAQG